MAEIGMDKNSYIPKNERDNSSKITSCFFVNVSQDITCSSVLAHEKDQFLKNSELSEKLKLIAAARRGDLIEIQALMRNGYNGEGVKLGVTPLVAAMRAGHINIVKSLIESIVSIDERLYQGRTALALAVAEGLEESVSLLVDGGAQINLADDSGVTPLMLASGKGSLRVVDNLFSRAECNVDQVDYAGKSALAHAAASGNVQIAKSLLDAGADPTLADNRRETILMLAARAACLPLVNLLLELKVNVNDRSNKGCTALMLCVGSDTGSGMYNTMERLIEAGADLHVHNQWYESVLMIACSAGLFKAVDFLTSCGADLNAKNVWGETPLMLAAEKGHYHIVELLLNRGSRVNERDEKNETVLMHAVKSLGVVVVEPPIQCIPKVKEICNDIYNCKTIGENPDAVKVVSLLLEAGSDVRAKNYCGQTALMIAAMHDRVKIVKVLIEKPETISNTSIVNMTCNCKLTALSYAAFCGNLPVLRQLLKYNTFVMNHMPEEVGQAVNMAVICDYPDIISALLKANLFQGLQPWKQLKFLKQSLLNACRRGKTESAKLLLEYLKDVGAAQDISWQRLFLIAVQQGHTDLLDLFQIVFGRRSAVWDAFIFGHIECLERIHRATEDSNKNLRLWKRPAEIGRPPTALAAQNTETLNQGNVSWSNLLDAVASGDGEMVRVLLMQDASLIKKSSATGLTALTYACLHGHKNVVGELLAKYKKSAWLDTADINGCTPLMYAARFGHGDCVQLLLRVGFDVKQTCRSSHTALTLASKMGYMEIVQMLISHGPYIPRRHETALHFAASGSYNRIVKLLLENRFDINQVDDTGQTPLIYAAYSGDESCVALLLQMGADPDRSDDKGRTALSYAAEIGKMAVVKLLLQVRCSFLKADKHGAMPIWHAAHNGFPDIVEELLEYDISTQHYNRSADCGMRSSQITPLTTVHPRALKYGRQNLRAATVNNVCKTDGSTPLMHICQHGFQNTVAFLCGKGATTDTTNNLGQTALHVAAMHNQMKVCKVLLVYNAGADVVDKQGRTPLLLALSEGHLKLVSLLETVTGNKLNETAMGRQVECTVENSTPGSTWVSFKSRFRMSFGRRSLGRKKDNQDQSSRVHYTIVSSRRNTLGLKENGGADVADEIERNDNRKDSSPKIEYLKTDAESQATRDVDKTDVTDSAFSTACFSHVEDEVCTSPSLLDSDFDPNHFNYETIGSLTSVHSLPLDKILGDGPNCESCVSVQRDLLSNEETVNQQVEPPGLNDKAHLLESQKFRPESVPQASAQSPAQRSMDVMAQLQVTSTLDGQRDSNHILQEETLQEQRRLRAFSERSHENKRHQEPLHLSDPTQHYMMGGLNSATPTQELALADTTDATPTWNLDNPSLDLESVSKTTIHAAVNKCLQQLPREITQDMTKSATSCDASASAVIQQNPCTCGGHGLTVHLNQVFHIKSRVKKKKCFRARSLNVARARYMATGACSKIMFRRYVRPPKGASKAANSNNGDADEGDDDDDDDDDEAGDGYETDSGSSSSSDEVEEDEEENTDSDANILSGL